MADCSMQNANAFLDVRKGLASSDAYNWQLVGGRSQVNSRPSLDKILARTVAADGSNG